jgi:hypothetical protein
LSQNFGQIPSNSPLLKGRTIFIPLWQRGARGKERENFTKEGERKGRNNLLNYRKSQKLMEFEET